jgi:hypothetical protein
MNNCKNNNRGVRKVGSRPARHVNPFIFKGGRILNLERLFGDAQKYRGLWILSNTPGTMLVIDLLMKWVQRETKELIKVKKTYKKFEIFRYNPLSVVRSRVLLS